MARTATGCSAPVGTVGSRLISTPFSTIASQRLSTKIVCTEPAMAFLTTVSRFFWYSVNRLWKYLYLGTSAAK